MLTGIVPKMAIRFTSYEWYKQMLAAKDGSVTGQSTFMGEWLVHAHVLFMLSWLACPSVRRQADTIG